MDAVRHTVHGIYKNAAEKLLPPLSKSQFDDKRVLTPQELVIAGDYLVRACPTWSWESGDPKKSKPYVPQNKQYLVTRNVPCLSRATELENYDPKSEFALAGDDDGWVATHKDPAAGTSTAAEDIPSIDDADSKPAAGVGDADDIPDMADLEIDDDEANVSAASPGYMKAVEPEDNIKRTRTYDLYITYDQYYQVPHFWMVGFDESRRPLTPQQILEDVSEEHAKKTITVETHPHLAVTAASIHPCRHAEVMKKLADNLVEAGKEFRVDQYLVLFLKFIASVVPTIQYDYTMSVGGD